MDTIFVLYNDREGTIGYFTPDVVPEDIQECIKFFAQALVDDRWYDTLDEAIAAYEYTWNYNVFDTNRITY